MASNLWKLTAGSTTKTLAEWGISNAVVVRRSLAADELRFSVTVADATQTPAFSDGQTLVLWRGASRWFIGEIRGTPAAFWNGREQRYGITAVNAWWKLERIIYKQPVAKKVQVGDSFVLSYGMSSQVILGRDAWGRKLSTDLQIANISQYALTQNSGAYTLSALATFTTPPLGEARDISCAAAILRMLEYTPDCASRFDYSSGTPVLYILRRGGMGSISLDLDDANKVVGIDGLRGRGDLKPAGVVFNFITVTEDADGNLLTTYSQQTAGTTFGPGVIYGTIQLSGHGSAEPEAAPTGLAAAYYAALNVTNWEGSITVKESECSGVAYPGQLLSLANGQAAWATMAAQIRQVTEDLDTGITQIELGLAPVLSPQDFADLMAKWRDKKPVSDFAETQHNGTEGVDVDEGDTEAVPGITAFGPAVDVATEDRTPNPKAGDAPSSLVVYALGQELPGMAERLAKVIYALNHASGTLTCNDPGPGGSIALTLPQLPES